MKTEIKKQKTTHARAAAAIKSDLKKAWPGVKFSVSSESFSMGDAVRIEWQDGPTQSQVEKLTKKYQYGHVDCMTDYYEHSNVNKDLPQTKYITTSRRMSEESRVLVLAGLCAKFRVDSLDYEGRFEPLNEDVCVLVRREFCKIDLSK